MTDFERKLASLSPVGVDRDAMLFATGRASAPSPRWWKRACGLLAVTQAVTLGLWLGERRGSTPLPEPPSSPRRAIPLPPPSPPDPSSYLVLLRTWDDWLPSPPDGGVEPSRVAPLTAGSRSF